MSASDSGDPDRTVLRQLRFERQPGTTEILLVRHGESAAFVDGEQFPEVDGQADPELHPNGREQAERIAERLAAEDIRAIYVTSLRRTVETAAPLARRLGLEPIVEPDLREVYLGEWEGGAFRRHLTEGHPLVTRLGIDQRWDIIPGAEPRDHFAERTERAIVKIAERHVDQCVCVFSHGATIGQVLARASGSAPFAFTGSDNGAISQLVVAADRWTVRRFNDTAHLTMALSTRAQPLT
jgi:probable phosphoglycerate mutase